MFNICRYRIFPLLALASPCLLPAAPNEPPAPPATQEAASFKSPVFDDLDQFHRIVILCDGGGSMINLTAMLREQLSAAVDGLSSEQSFNIIFFRDMAAEAVAKELLPATDENQQKAAAFLRDIGLHGYTDPIPGLEKAFGEKPDVIYFLDNGDYPDNDAVAKRIRELDKEKKAKVYTIALHDDNDADADAGFIDFFKRVAGEGGGKFKRVDAAKLAEPPFRSPVFADLDQFHRVIFLNDASGSMINTMASLKDQIDKAVVHLSTEQSFNIVFFQDRTGDWFEKEPARATTEKKKKAGSLLEGVTTTGTTDPLCCLDDAFRQNPDVIYLLTDGDFPDNDAVLKKFRELNKDKKVKAYTIAFVGAADTDTDFIRLLKTIASESGGKFRKVKEGDL